MRRFARVWMLGLLLPIGACRSNDRADLIEAELRTRERQIRELQDQLERERAINSAYDRQSRLPGLEPPAEGQSVASPGLPIKEVVIARGTSGVDEDGIPGDDGLLVVIVPRDEDRAAIKLPGSISISAYEITPDGLKVPFTTWEVGTVALRGMWQSGLFGSGYHVRMKWRNTPNYERLRVVVQFRTLDGRVLEAEKDISIRIIRNAVPMVVPGLSGEPMIGIPPAASGPILTTPEPQLLPNPLPMQPANPPLTPMPAPAAAPAPAPMTIVPSSRQPGQGLFPQPDLGPTGPPQAAIPDGANILPPPRRSTSNRPDFPVQLLQPVPYTDSPSSQ